MREEVLRGVWDELALRRKLVVLDYARDCGSVTRACNEFEVPRSTFYEWKWAYDAHGRKGLVRKKPIPKSHPRALAPQTVDLILDLRAKQQMGPERIMWYLARYHGIQTSESSVYRVLVKHGVNRLPKTAPRRALHTRRYAKSVPGHHIQMDVKFLWLKNRQGERCRRYQYTAIDDATRIRALQIYRRHNQESAIDFVDRVIKKFPFRIHTIRTDRGHEFQAQFHWHVEDLGIRHTYIKARTPQLNGKVERSHLTDDVEFYQLLTYTGDVDLNQKLKAWERFYNLGRPHSSLGGETPYERLRCLLAEA